MKEKIQELLQYVADQCQGHRAFIQIQVDNQYYTKRVGDMNDLVDHPDIVVKKATANFIEWMEGQWSRKPMAYRTRLNHRSCSRLLRKWNEGLTFGDLTSESVQAFDKWMTDRHYKVNTISKVMGIWRLYVRMAMDEDLIVRDPFRRYKMRSEATHKEALTERDVRKVEERVELLEGKEREVARGFLFSVYTGLRYSDVCTISREHIRKHSGHQWLDVRMRKTGGNVRVPLDSMFGGKALGLLHQGRGRQFDLPPNAQTNVILSRVMRRCGIRKHITMHCGRVTCATLCLSKGVPITTIQRVLGHRDITTTARVYAHLTDATMVKDVKRAWRN